jgi:pyruvate,water dikinase
VAWRKVIESKYSPRALSYRVQCGFLDVETPMGVLVLEMINPDISGVMYTKTPVELQNDDINIHSVYGLGELLVDGRVMPEIIFVKREDSPLIRKRKRGNQTHKIIPSSKGGTCLVEVATGSADPKPKVLDDHFAVSLAKIGITLENLFNEPQDVEWCIKKDGTILLLQSRPLQTHVVEEEKILECTFDDVEDRKIASGGQTACRGIVSGLTKHVKENKDIDEFPLGGILIATHALPDFAQILDRVGAVVTEEGSLASHFASVAREFGVPFIVGIEKAMEKIPDNTVVTVNAIERKIFKGRVEALLDNPCAQPRPLSASPFMRRFSFLMRFVSPLELVDPAAKNFTPTGCRSLHDIIRYSHETAINSMFQIGSNRWFNTRGVKKLDINIPVKMNVLDVGQGICDSAVGEKIIKRNQIKSLPMNAVLKGLLHPDIVWGPFSHFNWEEHDRLVMNGGIISPDNAMFASHAILAGDYANLNLKFGYHFVIVDALCSETLPDNQIRFRFSGGGASMEKRILRAEFLGRILSWLDFKVNIKHDLIDGLFVSSDMSKCIEKLDMVGRLLGATRLMDMYLKTDDQVNRFVQDFKNGIYHYTNGVE